ncbi:MAG: Stress responsive alpha-beta barrel domain protein [Mycobacterium sp.]|nr:Stress responsive alpha-beta barrel domain protein [Mycobacterium sp.]
MIVHVLRFRFKDGTTDEDSSACLEALRAVGRMDSVVSAVVGDHLGSETDRHTHSAAFTVADLAGFERYMGDPVHRRADFVLHPHVTEFDVFDISDEHDPELRAKIAGIQRRRLEHDPQLAALIGWAPSE